MKKNSYIFTYPLVMLALLSVSISSCKKEKTNNPEDSSKGKTSAVFNSGKTYESLTDIDKNVYKTIVIGTQTWMAENLRTTHYRNGDAIPGVTDNATWTALTAGAYCNYNNTQNSDTIATFGRLYNWYAVSDIRNIAPSGWHVPTDSEWTTLKLYLVSEAGGKLKETGATHWTNPNTGATNESGFTALPGGYRIYTNGAYYDIGITGSWWSSTEDNTSNAFVQPLFYNYTDGGGSATYNKKNGRSIRCIKD